jgi:hypothetical protein
MPSPSTRLHGGRLRRANSRILQVILAVGLETVPT